MTPADELTLAAERREALDAAATPGPWEHGQATPTTTRARQVLGTYSAVYNNHAQIAAVIGFDTGPDAAFIAAMRGVAKPLAAWLRAEVRFYISGDYTGHALILAREVIRATGGPGDER